MLAAGRTPDTPERHTRAPQLGAPSAAPGERTPPFQGARLSCRPPRRDPRPPRTAPGAAVRPRDRARPGKRGEEAPAVRRRRSISPAPPSGAALREGERRAGGGVQRRKRKESEWRGSSGGGGRGDRKPTEEDAAAGGQAPQPVQLGPPSVACRLSAPPLGRPLGGAGLRRQGWAAAGGGAGGMVDLLVTGGYSAVFSFLILQSGMRLVKQKWQS